MGKYWILLALLLPACSSVRGRYHTVAPGESLGNIASQFGLEASDLAESNPECEGSTLQPGMRLYIPFEKASGWNGEGAEFAERETAAVPAAGVRFSWPVSGTISSHFGKRRGGYHEGIDIAAGKGTPVTASRSGHVIYSGNGLKGYGNLVIVRHVDGYSTVYAHLSKRDAKKGQFVTKGARIGRVGRTGHATGNHLHFEIRSARAPVNPLLYLQGKYASNNLSSR